MRTLHHVLASVATGLILVRREAFHLHDSTFMMKILTAGEGLGRKSAGVGGASFASDKSAAAKLKTVCSFDHFKIIVLSLFGENILQLNEKSLDFTLRQIYKQVTVSAEPVFSAAHPAAAANVSRESSLNGHSRSKQRQERFSTESQLTTQARLVRPQVTELKLLSLTDLIKMVKLVAESSIQAERLVEALDQILSTFHLAVYKEIKYTDYRSAFTDLQKQFLSYRVLSHKDEALLKY